MAFQQIQWIVNSLALLGFTPLPALAQIVPDRTLPVNSNVSSDCSNCTITGGTVRGANLFHSFEQFSVPTGGSAYFNNSLNIQNILTRITGQSASSIDGLLRTNGSANLFLINPNGIIFGSNARLNIGGSFLASTATSIKFPDGEFNTNPAQSSPLLSINVPIGLGFGSSPAPIQVLGTGHLLTLQNPLLSPTIGASQSTSGLRVQAGKTIALVGGTVSLDGGILTAPSGRVEVAAVDSGDVSLTAIPQGFALTPGIVSGWKPIQLSNRALLDTSGLPGGSIQINGGKVSFTEGATALIQNAGVAEAGSIEINAREQAFFSGVGFQGNSPFPSRLINESVGPGKSGNVIISSPNLTVEAGANISARTYGSGEGGDVILNVPSAIVVRGFSLIFPDLFSHIVAATVGAGDAGNVIATTQTLIGQD
ncbi:MAG: filamentous hemagglutinin N-terminal domain-containing protein, partial [Oculatellaceae cyanobacterium bins.114]|nr:filamentous hemagglutinin N-terminal domain-containing protein [Oculatellaceae cyanobacterium bins.114]